MLFIDVLYILGSISIAKFFVQTINTHSHSRLIHSFTFRQSIEMDRTKNLYKNRHLADCKFKLPDDQILEANKTLLSFYSPVFESMFSGDLSEGQTGVVEIVDADYEIFDKFLM